MKILNLMLLLIFPTHFVLAQSQTKTATKADPAVKTADYNFGRNYVVRPQMRALDVAEQTTPKLQSFDLSFLANYEVKTYKMEEFYMNSSIHVPFSKFEPDIIPYYLRQQAFTVIRKKKNKR